MTALPKYQSPVNLAKAPAKRSKKVPVMRPRPQNYGAIAVEIFIKLSVNVVLSAAAITALSQLIPYQLSQQTKLQELELETAETAARVSQLEKEFEFNTDPSQAQRVMQEYSTRVNPNQVKVVFVEPEKKEKVKVATGNYPKED
jgi:cell division protein FtsB